MLQAQIQLSPGPVLAELTDIVRSVLDDPQLTLTEETTAEDVPGWDSMAHIAVVVEAECRFGVTFAVTELDALRRVGDLIRLIEVKRAAT